VVFKTTTRVEQPSDSEVELQVTALALEYREPLTPAAVARSDSAAAAAAAAVATPCGAGTNGETEDYYY